MREQTLLQGRLLHFIVFLPILGRSFFPQVRDASSITFQSSFSDPQILGVYALWAYCLYRFVRRPDTLKGLFALPLWPLTLFVVVVVASAFMVSNSLMYSLWRSIETAGVLLWGVLVLAELRNEEAPLRLFVSFYAMSALMLLGVVAAMVIDPQHAWMNDDSGVQRLATTSTFMMGANSIGVVAALLSLSALSRFMCVLKVHYFVLFGAFLALCYAARSRTGFIVFVLGALLLMVFSFRTPSRRMVTSISGLLLTLLVVGLLFVSPEFTDSITNTFTRGQNETNIKSLDGRVSIWTAALKAFEMSPILGSGYATYPMRIGAGGHFHNMFIELAVTTGVLGLIPVLILFALIAMRLAKIFSRYPNEDTPHQLVSIDALLIGTVLIVSEMTTAGAAYYSWQMIGIVMLAVGLYAMPNAQETKISDDDCSLEAMGMQETLISMPQSADFKPDRNSILL